MANVTRAQRLVAKAEAAFLAAVEIYNKPNFPYRDETFAILALNAWELLLKAKLVHEKGNHLRCLYVYETRKTKAGKPGKKRVIKKNRAGNPHTIGLGPVLVALETQARIKVPQPVRSNLEALVEIRDNAVHLMNQPPALGKRVLEIGTACVKNFIELSRSWFKKDLSRFNLYLMPIGFIQGPRSAKAILLDTEAKNLLGYLASLAATESEPGDDFNVALEVNIAFKRTSAEPVGSVIITNDPTATRVTMTEESIRTAFPWDYAQLTERLKARYSDFKENDKYHRVRSPLKANPTFCRTRYLDPDNPKGAKKDFFSPNILGEFDPHYTRR